MAHKRGFVSYALATIASVCFVSGLLVLTGGEYIYGELGDISSHNR